MDMPDDKQQPRRLFISYSRTNKAEVDPFVEGLTKAGINVWMDREEIEGFDDFPQRIRDGLGQSHALLAWYSPEYALSTFCQKELTAAWICSQRLSHNVLSRILVVNPVASVAHIALGDVAHQNFLTVPKDVSSQAACIHAIRRRLAGLSDDFSAVRELKPPEWHPSRQQGTARFVGRLRELWSIHTVLNPVGISDHENTNLVIQLRGLGGIGKSLLAIEYANRFGASYPGGIYWLRAYGFDPRKPMDADARERERRSQIENLALRNDVAIRDQDLRQVIRDLGRKLGAGPPYLWIVDDLPPGLDQGEGLPGWCAPSANGYTIITTRSADYEGVGVTLKVDVLDLKPAIELLTREREPQTDQERRDAEGLAEDLGRHALALAVAGLLLKTRGFAELREEVTGVGSDPLGALAAGLSGQLPGGHEKSIIATLVASVLLLEEKGLWLLRIACVMRSGTPIPLPLAKAVFRRAFALEEQTARDSVTLAISQLEMHSLANISPENEIFSVHSLVRYTMLHSDPAGGQAPELREVLRQSAVAAVVELFEVVRKPASLELEIEQAKNLATQPHTAMEVLLSKWLAKFEDERGHYREALAMTNRALPIQEQVLGQDSPDTLETRSEIASYTGQSGDAREALRLYRELLPDVQRVLGCDHATTLRVRNNMALWTANAGEELEALRLFRELLPDVQRLLGDNHRGTITIRKNIANYTGATGKEPEALQMFRDLLPDAQRVLGRDHWDTLTIRHFIARYTQETGEAFRLFRELLTDQERVLGPDHPATLATRRNVSFLTGKMGEVNEALRLCRELLPIHERVLGPDHPDTLAIRGYIAHYTALSGEKRDAQRLFRDLLADEERILGPGHPDTRDVRDALSKLDAQ